MIDNYRENKNRYMLVLDGRPKNKYTNADIVTFMDFTTSIVKVNNNPLLYGQVPMVIFKRQNGTLGLARLEKVQFVYYNYIDSYEYIENLESNTCICDKQISFFDDGTEKKKISCADES